jgi:uncharacterized SAM-binding protein YcdF (DUF218 family)
VAFLVLLILAAGATLAFRHAGNWLIRQDPAAQADAIAILSGSMPYRAEGAATIYRSGLAPEIWLTRPESPSPELQEMGIRYQGEEEYNREVLIAAGIPDSKIRILPGSIVDTEEEIEEITRQMRDERKRTVIIVTSPQHTRRVRALWNRLAGKDQTLIVWWRNTRDALAVGREYLGLLNVWLGLPVRPAPR